MTSTSCSTRAPRTLTELLGSIKYKNETPDIPTDPKFLAVRGNNLARYAAYRPSGLDYDFDLHAEVDLGVNIEFIVPDAYTVATGVDPETTLDSADHRLVNGDDFHVELDKKSEERNEKLAKRRAQHNKAVPWLKKTEYISIENNVYGVRGKVGELPSVKERQQKSKVESDKFWSSKEERLRVIENTFEKAKAPIMKHHSKPDVFPIEVHSLLPDVENWMHPFVQVTMDPEPFPLMAPLAEAKMSRALLRGMMDSRGMNFVGYFVPTDETLVTVKKEPGTVEDPCKTLSYALTGDYENIPKKQKDDTKKEKEVPLIFFRFTDDGVMYNQIETEIQLKKRHAMCQEPTLLEVSYKPELAVTDPGRELKMKQLEPLEFEEDCDPPNMDDIPQTPGKTPVKDSELENATAVINDSAIDQVQKPMKAVKKEPKAKRVKKETKKGKRRSKKESTSESSESYHSESPESNNDEEMIFGSD